MTTAFAPALGHGGALMLNAAAFRGGLPRHRARFDPWLFVAAAAGFRRFPNWSLPVAVGGLAFVVAVFAFGLG